MNKEQTPFDEWCNFNPEMSNNLESIMDEIKKHNVSSKQQAEKYEQLKCWSYAYLARWVVLERGVKDLYDLHNRECIRRGAIEWIEYLDGKRKNVPDKIKNFTIQTQSIPSYEIIKDFLGECSSIKEALYPNNKNNKNNKNNENNENSENSKNSKNNENSKYSKYRSKRNRIAHKAEEFRSEKDYLGYRKVIDKAIDQLLTKLSQKVNAKK